MMCHCVVNTIWTMLSAKKAANHYEKKQLLKHSLSLSVALFNPGNFFFVCHDNAQKAAAHLPNTVWSMNAIYLRTHRCLFNYHPKVKMQLFSYFVCFFPSNICLYPRTVNAFLLTISKWMNTLMDFPSAKEIVWGGKMTGNFHFVHAFFLSLSRFIRFFVACFDHNEYAFEKFIERNMYDFKTLSSSMEMPVTIL